MVPSTNQVMPVRPAPQASSTTRRAWLAAALLLPVLVLLLAAGRADAGSLYYTYKDSERIGRTPTTGSDANHNYLVAGNWAGDFKVGPLAINDTYLYAATIGVSAANEGLWQWSPSGYAGTQRIYYLTAPTAIATFGADLYWAEGGTVNRIGRRIGNTELKTFITTGVTDPGGLAVDADYVYWTNTSSGTIGRAKRDGTAVDAAFVSGVGAATGLAVNGTHLYWASENGGAGTTIGRANLDGSGVTPSFITGANAPHEVVVDAEYLYWTNSGGSSIGRAKLDGTGVDQSFITTPAGPFDLAIDKKRATSSTMTCTPAAPMTYRDSTCTVTIKDVDTGTKVVPTGPVLFADSSGGYNYFNPERCTLANPTSDSASCSVTYKPTKVGTWLVNATYEGAGGLTGARATLSQTVGLSPPAGQTTVTIDCTPTTPTVETASTCTVRVTDVGATPEAPIGAPSVFGAMLLPAGTNRVFVPSRGSGTTNGECQLVPVSAVASECTVRYYPPAEGADRIAARYAGVTGRWIAPADEYFSFTVGPRRPRPTTSTIDCGAERAKEGEARSCTVIVEDDDFMLGRYPLGIVEVVDASGGSFRPASGRCALNPLSPATTDPERGARSSCRITYVPARAGTSELRLEYVGGPTHATSTAQVALAVDALPKVDPPTDGGVTDQSLPPVVVPPVVLAPPTHEPQPAPYRPFSISRPTAKQRATLARSGRVSLSVQVPTTDRVTGRMTARIGKRTVSVGTVRVQAQGAGKHRLRLTLSPRARSILKRSGRLRVSIEVRCGAARKSMSVTLKRAPTRSAKKARPSSAKKATTTSSRKASR